MGIGRTVIAPTYLDAPANSDASFPGVPAVNRAGRTDRFEVFYDRFLGEAGRVAGSTVLDRAERDLTTISGWFDERRLPHENFTVVLAHVAGGAGASRHIGGEGEPTTLYCDVQTTPHLEALQSSFFVTVLLADLYANDVGWDANTSAALARVLAAALYPRRVVGFATARIWLESVRDDFVSTPLAAGLTATGCAVLFFNYLHHQLGFSWREIAATPAPTLGDVAKRLTGSDDELNRFQSLLAEHLPVDEPVAQPTDNVFPLADLPARPRTDVALPKRASHGREAERRVCLLTGSSGTLGTYLCETFGDRFDFCAVYRRNPPPVGVHSVKADLTVDGESERVVEVTLERFGRLDLVVNAAVASTWGPMLTSEPLWSSAPAQFLTNVVVPLRVSCAAARLFWRERVEENRAASRGIVNVSSVSGRNIYPNEGQSVYAASKAALDHLTGHMALEFAAIGVKVNAVAPNSFPSNVGTSRVAQAIIDLDDGDGTGAIVVVDGATDQLIPLVPAFARPR
ncbi:MAG: SDR family oxidoreductase [Actinomycetota bacterium]|nr:SDR family oxidoreductase [Actinomycetota bacterium]